MDELRSQSADNVIKNHMLWSMGAGMIPIPIADFFAVSAVQLDMVRQLTKLYNVDFKETEGKAIISALTSSVLAKAGARAAVKMVPIIGSVIGGVAMGAISGGATYALGHAFKRHFETGGTILDFDMNRLKKVFDEKFEKGKEYAEELQKEHEATKKKADDLADHHGKKVVRLKVKKDFVDQLKEIADMRDKGLLTEEEFETLKQKILDSE